LSFIQQLQMVRQISLVLVVGCLVLNT